MSFLKNANCCVLQTGPGGPFTSIIYTCQNSVSSWNSHILMQCFLETVSKLFREQKLRLHRFQCVLLCDYTVCSIQVTWHPHTSMYTLSGQRTQRIKKLAKTKQRMYFLERLKSLVARIYKLRSIPAKKQPLFYSYLQPGSLTLTEGCVAPNLCQERQCWKAIMGTFLDNVVIEERAADQDQDHGERLLAKIDQASWQMSEPTMNYN